MSTPAVLSIRTNAEKVYGPELDKLWDHMDEIEDILWKAHILIEAQVHPKPSQELWGVGNILGPAVANSVAEAMSSDFFEGWIHERIFQAQSQINAIVKTPVPFSARPSDPSGDCVCYDNKLARLASLNDSIAKLLNCINKTAQYLTSCWTKEGKVKTSAVEEGPVGVLEGAKAVLEFVEIAEEGLTLAGIVLFGVGTAVIALVKWLCKGRSGMSPGLAEYVFVNAVHALGHMKAEAMLAEIYYQQQLLALTCQPLPPSQQTPGLPQTGAPGIPTPTPAPGKTPTPAPGKLPGLRTTIPIAVVVIGAIIAGGIAMSRGAGQKGAGPVPTATVTSTILPTSTSTTLPTPTSTEPPATATPTPQPTPTPTPDARKLALEDDVLLRKMIADTEQVDLSVYNTPSCLACPPGPLSTRRTQVKTIVQDLQNADQALLHGNTAQARHDFADASATLNSLNLSDVQTYHLDKNGDQRSDPWEQVLADRDAIARHDPALAGP